MANTYIWFVEQMQVKKIEDQFEDVVYNVWWRCNATDLLGNSATQYGIACVALDPNDPAFIPYAELTEDTVVNWVKNVVDGNAVEATLDGKLVAKEAASNQDILPLPWAE